MVANGTTHFCVSIEIIYKYDFERHTFSGYLVRFPYLKTLLYKAARILSVGIRKQKNSCQSKTKQAI